MRDNMVNLTLQKRLAADLLKVGRTRVWLDPEKMDDIKNAITRADVRKLINRGYIKATREKIKKTKPKKKKRNVGRRKGAAGARLSSKRKWINTVRPLRRMIKELRDTNKIDKATYRKLYLSVKAGTFRSRAHLRLHLQQRGIISEKK